MSARGLKGSSVRKSIEEQLVGVGNLIAEAKRKARSLSAAERRMIDRLHTRAIQESGYGWTGINALEMEGERGLKGSMPMPVEAVYIGSQDGIFGLSCRLYNIEGDHPLNNSTVGVSALVRERIPILDLSFAGVWRELAKEQFLIAACFAFGLSERIRSLFARRRS